MKIGLIGNMNNNNFALMRYFRDLGADAHLLLYSNDGVGSLTHFSPEADCWDFTRWASFVRRTQVPNSMIAALDFPLSWLIAVHAGLGTLLGRRNRWEIPITCRAIRRAYGGYDRLLAAGITPATLARAGMRLDIFYPYSISVEFLESPEFLSRFRDGSALHKLLCRRIAGRQADGIRASRKVLNYEPGPTESTLAKLGVSPLRLSIPMVYNRERLPDAVPSPVLAEAVARIADSQLSVLHHARVIWCNDGRYTAEEWRVENKNTQWLIAGFAAMRAARPEFRSVLIMVEYGPDVRPAKELIAELGIGADVHWLPKLQRRELMWLLSRVTVGCGEFYDVPRMIWGGTGWETLASGRPLLQAFNFKDGEFESLFGYPPPPMLPVRSQKDVEDHLTAMLDEPSAAERIGRASREWFNRHNGAGLAARWLELISESSSDQNKTAAGFASVDQYLRT